jgi:hypothetical protein
MPTPRTQIVVRAVVAPGEVVEYPIDTIEWGRDAATGQWYMQIYALQPPPATTLFEVKIVSPAQKSYQYFIAKF